MCADERDNFGVDVVIAAADACSCNGTCLDTQVTQDEPKAS